MRHFIAALSLFSLALLSGCTFSAGESTTRLSIAMREADPNLADFGCFFVNIAGANITPTVSGGDADAKCMGIGVVSALFKVEEHAKEPLLLKIPSGAARTVQVIGVKNAGNGINSCKGLTNPQELFKTGQPVLHVVSSTVTDIYKDTRIDLRNQYDKDKATDLVAPCVPKPIRIPTIKSITPSSGPIAGDTVVTIAGTNFAEPLVVTLAGADCRSVTAVDENTIQCKTTAHAYATGDVVVKTDAGSAVLVDGFTYLGDLYVGSISPAVGSTAGGDTITITGVGFVADMTVEIGSNNCASVSVQSQTQLTCVAPPGPAGPANVTARITGGNTYTANNIYTYAEEPLVSSVSLPRYGPLAGGQAVIVTGNNFDNPEVDFGNSPCDISTTVSPTSISCTTRAHAAGKVTVTVKNSNGLKSSLANGYEYVPAPNVTSLSPDTAAPGVTIVVNGTGFLPSMDIKVGTTTCTAISNITSISADCKVPTLAGGDYTVTVTNEDAQTYTTPTALLHLTSGAAPSFTNISPNLGTAEGETLVTINGSNFAPGVTVTLGGSYCTPVTFNGPGQITCTTGMHSPVQVALVITNPDTQTATQPAAYTYLAGPAVTNAGLTVGPPSNPGVGIGHSLSMTGTFIPNVMVTLKNGLNCNVTNSSISSTICDTLGLPAGWVNVRVENAGGGSTTLTNAYRVGPGDAWVPSGTIGAPTERSLHTASRLAQIDPISKIAIWGGEDASRGVLGDGAIFDLNKGEWSPLSKEGSPPSPRKNHTAVWTGTEMVVWGGTTASGDTNTGAKFNPMTNSWTALPTSNAPSKRSRHAAVWTGSAMIVYGGIDTSDGSYPTSAGSYIAITGWDAGMTSPAVTGRTDHTMIWDGTNVQLFGGRNAAVTNNDLVSYNPGSNLWTPSASPGKPSARHSHTATLAAGYMVVYGGSSSATGELPLNDGSRLEIGTGNWDSSFPMATGPGARVYHQAVSIDGKVYVWGGKNGTYLVDGGIYEPINTPTGLWTTMSVLSTPVGRVGFTMAATDKQFFIFGGTSIAGSPINTGAHYLTP